MPHGNGADRQASIRGHRANTPRFAKKLMVDQADFNNSLGNRGFCPLPASDGGDLLRLWRAGVWQAGCAKLWECRTGSPLALRHECTDWFGRRSAEKCGISEFPKRSPGGGLGNQLTTWLPSC